MSENAYAVVYAAAEGQTEMHGTVRPLVQRLAKIQRRVPTVCVPTDTIVIVVCVATSLGVRATVWVAAVAVRESDAGLASATILSTTATQLDIEFSPRNGDL